MTLYESLQIIIVIAFFIYIIKRDKHRQKYYKYSDCTPRKPKKHKKTILSVRDTSKCHNDHTTEYIQYCWDEVEKECGYKRKK